MPGDGGAAAAACCVRPARVSSSTWSRKRLRANRDQAAVARVAQRVAHVGQAEFVRIAQQLVGDLRRHRERARADFSRRHDVHHRTVEVGDQVVDARNVAQHLVGGAGERAVDVAGQRRRDRHRHVDGGHQRLHERGDRLFACRDRDVAQAVRDRACLHRRRREQRRDGDAAQDADATGDYEVRHYAASSMDAPGTSTRSRTSSCSVGINSW